MNRRQVLEAAAKAERSALWMDLAAAVWRGEGAPEQTVARIKLLSHAIGYASPWPSIPTAMLRFYEVVESDATIGIYAERVPWPQLSDAIDTDAILPVTDEERDAIKAIKPYDPEWDLHA